MNPDLRDELVRLDAHDQAVRAELAADGSLFDGYHPRMAAVHRANAARLSAILDRHGWPGLGLVGEPGAASAWRIAQHAIGDPPFMRRCRDLLADAVAAGDALRWQFAFMDDRIRTFEGRPQRYGTQLRGGPGGVLEPHPLDDPAGVEARRAEAGLPPPAEVLAKARANPTPPARDQAARDAEELRWRREVGWVE